MVGQRKDQRERVQTRAARWSPHRIVGRLTQHEGRLAALETSNAELHARAAAHSALTTTLHDHVHRLTAVVHASNVWVQVQRGTEWAAVAPLESTPLISVILPTRNREARLGRALESIRNQSYGRWELIIVNDGSTDGTAESLGAAAEADERLRIITTVGVGGAAARNAGLAAASGTIVAFLDDDNTMTRHWLRAVADHFGRHHDHDAVYGAQLRLPPASNPDDPIDVLFVSDFDLDVLVTDNFIDLGVLAVRTSHPQLRFDPDLKALQDWELVVRIAASSGITPLPALASCYSEAAPGRISEVHGGEVAVLALRARLRETVAELQPD